MWVVCSHTMSTPFPLDLIPCVVFFVLCLALCPCPIVLFRFRLSVLFLFLSIPFFFFSVFFSSLLFSFFTRLNDMVHILTDDPHFFFPFFSRPLLRCFVALNTDEEKSSMLLVMRVLSIVPLNFKVRFFYLFFFLFCSFFACSGFSWVCALCFVAVI